MSEGSDNREVQVAQLSSLTGLDRDTSERYLNASNGDLTLAASLFFDEHQEQGQDSDPDVDMADEPSNPEPAPPQRQPVPGGGRTLDGTYVPPPAGAASSASSSRAASKAPQRGGPRTIKDLQGDGGHGHAHDDDDDDDKEDQDFFAGGEKSGLAVQNPNASNPRDQINKLIKRARQNVPRPGDEDELPASTHFRGAGTTLGGDDAPSRTIPDPAANTPAPAERAHRELHLWRDGFSVDDGALFRYDDPANARTLEMINTGHAPLHILNVEHGQEVDVEVHAHKDEDYKQPKKKYAPFGGSGQRLGSPTPGAGSSASAPTTATPSSATATAASPAAPSVDVDAATPTITLQIRLGDGTRLQSRFNTTHTVGDVYSFVARASPASQTREYALMTTFPSKDLTDKAQVLGDMPEFKRGGVVVQKWK